MAKSLAVSAAAVSLLVAGCSFAPAYTPPTVETPTAFKEGGAMTPAAADGEVARRDWWVVYGDPQLDALEADLARANSSLASAVARYDQSRALAAEAWAWSLLAAMVLRMRPHRSSS